MRGEALVSAPGPSAVIRRSENARIFDSFESKLPASVAPRSTAAPFVRGAPKRLFSAPQTGRCACSRHKNVRRCTDAPRRGAACLPCFPCIHALKRHTLSAEQGFADRQRFQFFCRQERFSGAARLSRAPKNARCSARAPSCSAAHVLLRCCRRILGAPIFKVHKY